MSPPRPRPFWVATPLFLILLTPLHTQSIQLGPSPSGSQPVFATYSLLTDEAGRKVSEHNLAQEARSSSSQDTNNNNNSNNNNNNKQQITGLTDQSISNSNSKQEPQQQQQISLISSLNSFDSLGSFMNASSNGLTESDLLQAALLAQYYMPQYYDSPASSTYYLPTMDSSYPQSSYYYPSNHGPTAKISKPNKTHSLGRRIGELVSNSAERATRAFRSFPKLLNDIKPSKLLGLSNSDGSSNSNSKAIVVNASALVSQITSPSNPSGPSQSSWYLPGPTWNSFAPPPAAPSLYFQQPVFVRTADLPPSPSPLGSMMAPPPPPPASPSPLHSDFFSHPKMASMDQTPAASNPPVHFHPASLPSPPPPQVNPSSPNPPDLYAAPQTQFGMRVKPPKDYDEYGSNEDEMSSGDGSDPDSKMANEGGHNSGGHHHHHHGHGNHNSGDNSGDNGGGDGPGSSQGPNWANSGPSTPYDDFPDSEGSYYNSPPTFQGPYYTNPTYGNTFRFPSPRPLSPPRRPLISARPLVRPTGLRGKTSPYSMEFDEPDNWYNTFFGANVKSLNSRFRYPGTGLPAAAFPGTFTYPTPAASTPSPASLAAPGDFLHSLPSTTFHSPALTNAAHSAFLPRPTWSHYPTYHHYPTQSFYPATHAHYQARPLMTAAASSLRPVALPLYPTNPAPSYFLPRYHHQPRALPWTYHTQLTPFYPRYHPTFTPISAAASQLYPVRLPYTPLTQPYPTLLPAITHPPVLRYRYPDMTSTRRSFNITKRADESAPEVKHPSKETSSSLSQNDLSTWHSAYQILSKRAESSEPKSYYFYQHNNNLNSNLNSNNTLENSSNSVLTTTTTTSTSTESSLVNSSLDLLESSSNQSIRTLRNLKKRDQVVKNTSEEIRKYLAQSRVAKKAFSRADEWKPVFKPVMRAKVM